MLLTARLSCRITRALLQTLTAVDTDASLLSHIILIWKDKNSQDKLIPIEIRVFGKGTGVEDATATLNIKILRVKS
jgi:hypothetical protein